MRPIDADKLKRKAQKVGTEAWKMNLTAKVETTLNQFIDWIDEQPTIQQEKAQLLKESTTSDLISRTETAEHLRRVLEATVPNTDYDEGYIDGIEFGISTVSTMPTVQPVATDTNVGGTISRQAVIDAVEKNACNTQRIMDAVNNLPPAQPEPSILLSWVEKYIEWLRSLDNEFANLAAAHISVMVKKWRDEQDETD